MAVVADIAVVLVRLVQVDCTWGWVVVVADIAVAVELHRADLHLDLGVDRLDWGSNYSVHIVLVGVVAL